MVIASARLKRYFEEIDKKTRTLYELANRARKVHIDPEDEVEIKLAENLAERIYGLISIVAPNLNEKELTKRIMELEKQYEPLDWRVALTIALEVAQQKFGKFTSQREAIEVGIRTGFAYQTVGIVSAPLEGFTELVIKKRKDGKDYFCLKYSGPVRGAGGTGAAFSVLLADYVRKKLGYSSYDPDENEIKRYCTEIDDYCEKVTVPQYHPSHEEISFLVRNIPVEISGDPTEKFEVSNYKDLPRVETNRVRGGMVLVMAMLALKAPKLWKRISKWGKEFDLDHWFWLDDFIKLQEEIKASLEKKRDEKEEKEKLKPNYVFISELVAGRPVFSYPLRSGGFRVRYGRTRTSGFSSSAIHPATMAILEDFIAIGTQLKAELPGKGTGITICDTIEPPIVLLNNGSVKKVRSYEEGKMIRKDIKEILYLGDILFNYGDFSENNHVLVPAGYCNEWWYLELERKIEEQNKDKEKIFEEYFCKETLKNKDNRVTFVPKLEEAIKVSEDFKVPLHPEYIYYWSQVKISDIIELYDALLNHSSLKDNKIVMDYVKEVKRTLELIGLEHELINNEKIVIKEPHSLALLLNLGIDKDNYYNSIERNINKIKELTFNSTLDLINQLSKYEIRDKAGTFIGARMGRPEKAKLRKMKGSPQVLFPVGEQGGRMRSLTESINQGFVIADFPKFKCIKCGNETVFRKCEKCGGETIELYYCRYCNEWMTTKTCKRHNSENVEYNRRKINIRLIFNNVKKQFKIKDVPELIKGVRGTSNRDHIPEHLVKGILRAKYDLTVNKDGTIRYDATELPITHFKPKEIHVSVEKLRELGYEKDIFGNPLVNDDQILEIFPQDIILPTIKEGFDEGADKVFIRVAQFIDELLVKVYGLEPYYNIKTRDDLLGHLVIGLAPHISAGMVGRIIGFSDTQAMICSPLFHAALRRDCDGDEGCLMLALDAFLNFSRRFLPDKRGSRTMDAPLVLTTILNPSEVDDMVLGLDIAWHYPLEFYEATLKFKNPSEIEIEQVKHRLGKENQYEHYGYTHETDDFNKGNLISAYKVLPTMLEKLDKEMELAKKIRAVDENDVARLVIEKHFLKDLKGNLRKFSIQQFRCVNCNEKYRRPPLVGRCLNCGGRIIFTISEGSVIKYLEPSLKLAKIFKIPDYLDQTLKILSMRIESMFGKEKEKQEGLTKFFT